MLSEITAGLFENFEAKDAARESTIKLSRNIIRLCSRAIKSIHRNDFSGAGQIIAEASALNELMKSNLEKHPDIYFSGIVENAQQEYAEAVILFNLLQMGSIPSPSQLGVEDPAYLLGLGDVVGELRRSILDLIRIDKAQEGEKLLNIMDEILSAIILFDFPDALYRGLRHKGDVARNLVERTRGDLTNALGNSRLKASMQNLEKMMK